MKFVPSIAFSVTRQRPAADKPPGRNWAKALENRHKVLKVRRVRALDWNRHEKNINTPMNDTGFTPSVYTSDSHATDFSPYLLMRTLVPALLYWCPHLLVETPAASCLPRWSGPISIVQGGVPSEVRAAHRGMDIPMLHLVSRIESLYFDFP
jgi:hypothetical protein